MAVVLPRFLNIDGEYGANDLGWPFRFLVTEGVCGIGDLAVTQNGTPNMSVNVAAGRAFILGDDNPDTQPNYLFYNDATVNLAVPAADLTNPRIDIVVAEVRDSTFGGAADDGRLRVITGTPAGSPSAPATPDNCLKLAELSIPAGDTTITNDQITDTRPVAQPGGELALSGKLTLVVADAASLPGATEGLIAYVADTNKLYIANGAAWVEILDLDTYRRQDNTSTFSVWATTTTSPNAGVDTQVALAGSDEMRNASLSSSRVTPAVPGLYRVGWAVFVDNAGAGTRVIGALAKNGVIAKQASANGSDPSIGVTAAGSALVRMNGTTDYFSLVVNISAAGKAVSSGAHRTWLDGEWIAP